MFRDFVPSIDEMDGIKTINFLKMNRYKQIDPCELRTRIDQ